MNIQELDSVAISYQIITDNIYCEESGCAI